MQTAQRVEGRRVRGFGGDTNVGLGLVRSRAAFIAATLVGLLSVVMSCLYSGRQWIRFDSPSWDLGIFAQLAKAYSSFSVPIVPIKGDGFNLLGDHFHPLLVLLGPIFAVFPSAFTLLVVQNLLFGLGVAIVTFAGVTHIGRVSGCAVGLAFAVSWGLQTAVEAQFHEIAFAVPLLAMALSAYLSERWISAAIWIAPLVFVKEDLGITVAAFATLLFWRTRDPRALWLAIWGVGWTALAVIVLLPLLNPDGNYDYGLTNRAQASDPLGLLVATVIEPQKYETLGLLVVITAGIALRSPLVLLVIPTLAWRMLSSNESYWGTTWHYSAILMPILFMAAIDGIRGARESGRRWTRRLGMAAPIAMILVGLVLVPSFPYRALLEPAPFSETYRSQAAQELLDTIPADASVNTDITLMAYLVPTTTVFWWGNRSDPPADYIALDLNSGSWTSDLRESSAAAYGEAQHPGVDYVDIFNKAGFEVAKRID